MVRLWTYSETILANFHKLYRLNVVQCPNDSRIYKFLLSTKSSTGFDELLEELVMLLKLCSLETVPWLKNCLVFAVNCDIHYPGYTVNVFHMTKQCLTPMFDKANLFLGGGQTLHFTNFVFAISANQSL